MAASVADAVTPGCVGETIVGPRSKHARNLPPFESALGRGRKHEIDRLLPEHEDGVGKGRQSRVLADISKHMKIAFLAAADNKLAQNGRSLGHNTPKDRDEEPGGGCKNGQNKF